MTKLRSFFGYAWALAALPIVLATFIGLNTWAKGLAEVTGVKISPWYSGGEVERVVPHDGYKTTINKPVFQGLVSERKQGFVQLKWTPNNSQSLPLVIDEEIHLDGDGKTDFRVRLDTRTDEAQLNPYSSYVVSVNQVLNLGEERAVRVKLTNPRRLPPTARSQP